MRPHAGETAETPPDPDCPGGISAQTSGNLRLGRSRPAVPSVTASRLLSGVFLLTVCFAVHRLSGNYVNLHLFHFTHIGIFLLTGLCGSLGVLLLCRALPEEIGLLRLIGRSTAGIMVLHYTPLPLYRLAVSLTEKTGSGDRYVLTAVILMLFGVVLTQTGKKISRILRAGRRTP